MDKDVGVLSEQDKEVAQMEEDEAKAIQKRLAAEVDEDAFGLQYLQPPDAEVPLEPTPDPTKQKLAEVDLSKLPSKKLMKVIAEESPELQGLIEDCRAKLEELNAELGPMLDLVNEGRVPQQTASIRYLRFRHNILISYITNICFYISLKAKRVNIRNHPIVKRLSQLKKVIVELDRTRELLLPQVQQIILMANNGVELNRKKASTNTMNRSQSRGNHVDSNHLKASRTSKGNNKKQQQHQEVDDDDDDDDSEQFGEWR